MIQYISPLSVLRVDYTLRSPLYSDKISKLSESKCAEMHQKQILTSLFRQSSSEL